MNELRRRRTFNLKAARHIVEGKMRWLLFFLLQSSVALAGMGKILDVSPYNEHGPIQVTNIGGYPNPIVTQGTWEMFTVTIALDGFAYSANFRAKRGFHSTDLIVGDPIEAVVDGKNLVITRTNGKTERAKIIRKARV